MSSRVKGAEGYRQTLLQSKVLSRVKEKGATDWYFSSPASSSEVRGTYPGDPNQSEDRDFNFLHKPIMYGVAHLLYGVALSASVLLISQQVGGSPQCGFFSAAEIVVKLDWLERM